jgi:hypothetical protein
MPSGQTIALGSMALGLSQERLTGYLEELKGTLKKEVPAKTTTILCLTTPKGIRSLNELSKVVDHIYSR